MKKINIILISLFFPLYFAFSQDTPNIMQVETTTPEVSSLIKYIHNPVDYSRGLANISIPLYEVAIEGVTLSINLNYHHGGIKAEEFSEWLGVGWSLSAEPVIARKIRGKEDQKVTLYSPEENNASGGDIARYTYLKRLATSDIDEEPDDFYYTLLNKSGMFMFKKNVTNQTFDAVTVPYEPIKIERNIERNSIQKLIITDEKGIKYTFDQQETTYDYEGTANLKPIPDVSAWKCSKIQNSNERVLFQFSYEKTLPIEKKPTYSEILKIEDIPTKGTNARLEKEGLPRVANCSHFNCTLSYARVGIDGSVVYDPSNPKYYMMTQMSCNDKLQAPPYCYIQSLRLKKILFDNGSINFGMNDKNTLTSITAPGKTIRLIHDNSGDYPMLIGLEIGDGEDVKHYSFEYNADLSGNILPKKPQMPEEISLVDYWGNLIDPMERYGTNPMIDINFWYEGVGEYNNTTISRYFTHYATSYINREHEISQHGVLKAMVNPAGCRTEFEYESHYYIKNIPENYTSYYYYTAPYDTFKVVAGGGLRIRKINYSDPLQGTQLTRVFKYGQEKSGQDRLWVHAGDAETGLGIIKRQIDMRSLLYSQTKVSLAHMSPIQHQYQKTRIRTFLAHIKGNSNSFGSPVMYDKVTEYNITTDNEGNIIDNGKTVYTYDINGFSDIEHYSGSNVYYDDIGSVDWAVGKLRAKEIYKKSSNNAYQLISKTAFEYQLVPGTQNNTSAAKVYQDYIIEDVSDNDIYTFQSHVRSELGISLSQIYNYYKYNIPTGAIRLTSEIDSIFDTPRLLVKERKFEYGNPLHLQPTKIEETNSDGTTITKQFFYPQDNGSVSTQQHITAKNMLISKNILIPILEEKTTYTSSGLTSTHKILNEYKVFNNNQPLPYINKTQRDNGTLTEEIICYKYDVYGNPIHIKDRNGMETVYIWSYWGLYPIAIIKNASYTTVDSALGNNTPESFSSIATPNMTSIENLRNKSSLQNSEISTYTYELFKGIKSATDPRGLTTYYNYDGLGRLKEIYIIENNEKKILQAYDYHYRE